MSSICEALPGFNDIDKSTIKHLTHCTKLSYLSECTNLEILEFADSFNQELEYKCIPSTVHTIIFGAMYNKTINQSDFPSSLKVLQLGLYYNEPLVLERMESLTDLTTGDMFNFQLNYLPPNLQKLTLGNAFNSFMKLPHSLIELHCGSSFNQPLDDIISDNIEILTLGESFDKSLNSIPSKLKILNIPKSSCEQWKTLSTTHPYITIHCYQSSNKHELLDKLTYLHSDEKNNKDGLMLNPYNLHIRAHNDDLNDYGLFDIKNQAKNIPFNTKTNNKNEINNIKEMLNELIDTVSHLTVKINSLERQIKYNIKTTDERSSSMY